mgnify:FL=1
MNFILTGFFSRYKMKMVFNLRRFAYESERTIQHESAQGASELS